MPINDANTTRFQSSRKLVPVVAVRGAAGSLGAIFNLLRSIPDTTGMAFVYVQHTDLIPVSQLSSMLSQATAMPIVAADHSRSGICRDTR